MTFIFNGLGGMIKMNETYLEWVNRNRLEELNLSLNQLAKGKDPMLILEILANRLTNKMLFPLYDFIYEDYKSTYNPTLSKTEYEEYFTLKNLKPKADHIVDD